MTTYRCPSCKHEIESTRYCKIISITCRPCKKQMAKLYNPTDRILKEEMIINLSFLNEETKLEQN